ncbi:SUKH-3 domain-containing protein [Paenibacillus sp. MMO-58]|uniref:SUKH-3 domain-containing protein n=1 Tax=Paenibacillus sp. MMO-58 TaxID=3081290 RepID=UPI00301AE1E4
MSIKSEEFLINMLEFLPSTGNGYEKSIERYGEVLETVIIEDFFLPDIIKLLSENRNIKLLESIFDVHERVINFLAQYGGLTIKQPAYKVPNKTTSFHFNPNKAINHINKERVETYEERINSALVVIGEADNEHLILMMTPSGGIYGALDDYLTFLGNNPKEAIEALCEGKETF